LLQNGTAYPIGDSTLAGKSAKDCDLIFVADGHVTRGAWTISQPQRADDAELHLLFAHGKRPDRLAIASFVASRRAITISHDPFADNAPHAEAPWAGQQYWLELLTDGLTFDLTGLAPGPASAFPTFAHRFDLPILPLAADHDVLTLRPGPHLAGGPGSMPVNRAMLGLACDLVRHFADLVAVAWPASGSVIGRRYFESVTSAWLDGGPFPALGLTAFIETPDGALQSTGLGFWIGQELRIEPPLSTDRVAATRLGVRLVNHLVLIGGLDADDRITAPDGTRLVLRASHSRAMISVWRE
jgi:hypothetical protein